MFGLRRDLHRKRAALVNKISQRSIRIGICHLPSSGNTGGAIWVEDDCQIIRILCWTNQTKDNVAIFSPRSILKIEGGDIITFDSLRSLDPGIHKQSKSGLMLGRSQSASTQLVKVNPQPSGYFFEDIRRPIGISINEMASSSAVQPSFYPLPRWFPVGGSTGNKTGVSNNDSITWGAGIGFCLCQTDSIGRKFVIIFRSRIIHLTATANNEILSPIEIG